MSKLIETFDRLRAENILCCLENGDGQHVGSSGFYVSFEAELDDCWYNSTGSDERAENALQKAIDNWNKKYKLWKI